MNKKKILSIVTALMIFSTVCMIFYMNYYLNYYMDIAERQYNAIKILDDRNNYLSEVIEKQQTQLKEVGNQLKDCQAKKDKQSTFYRLTSYYPAETSNITGSGLTTSSFEVNEKGWYTYKGKLVLAGATEELLRSGYSVRNANIRQKGKHYFRYYDTLTIEIDGIKYEGIILDSCGAAAWEGYTRLDLFVSDKKNVIDRKNVKVWVD